MNNMDNEKIVPLDNTLLSEVNGGWLVESAPGDARTFGEIYNAGISIESTWVGSSRYFISGGEISFDLADKIIRESKKIWKKYQGSADWVGYAREWKTVLREKWSIEWDGLKGTYWHTFC